MSERLPSLNALRAFEATARHLNFTRAAAELNVTQTAISHRIGELETLLSTRLFNRSQNSISLTEDGRRYLDMVRPAMTQIAVATQNISETRGNQLHIMCLSAFATKCLIPRLADFRERYPDIQVRVTPANASFSKPTQHDFDVGIWHGHGDWPGYDVQKLGDEEIFPVCSPGLLSSNRPLLGPEDIQYYPVVRTVCPIVHDDWPSWMRHAGIKEPKFGEEINCEALFLSLDAALSGLGLAIGRSQIVANDLASGRLVEPFDVRLKTNSGYHIVSRTDRTSLKKVVQFRSWLLEQLGCE